jgi:hypothetical protein
MTTALSVDDMIRHVPGFVKARDPVSWPNIPIRSPSGQSPQGIIGFEWLPVGQMYLFGQDGWALRRSEHAACVANTYHQLAQRMSSLSSGTGHFLLIVTQKYSSINFVTLDSGLPSICGRSTSLHPSLSQS